MDDLPVVAVYGDYEIRVVDDPMGDEVKEYDSVYSVYNTQTGVREYESPHYLHALKFIHDSVVYVRTLQKAIVDSLAAEVDGADAPDIYNDAELVTPWDDNA